MFGQAEASTSSSSGADTERSTLISLSDRGLAQQDYNFTELLRHVMTDQPNSKWPFGILSLTALASTWMYIAPSLKEGEAEGGAWKWLQLIGNTGAAAFVVFNVGGHYIDLLKASQDALSYLKKNNLIEPKVAKKVSGVLSKLLYQATRVAKGAASKIRATKLDILIIAALTAIPLATAAWSYKDFDKESNVLLALKTLVTFWVYTLIHTLPVSLILEVPWLNFLLVKIPMSPFILLRHVYIKCAWSGERLESNRAEQQELKAQAAIRLQMVGSINALISRIQQGLGFKHDQCWFTPKLPENYKLPADVNSAEDSELFAWLAGVFAFYGDVSAPANYSSVRNCLSSVNRSVRGVWGSAGAGLAGSCLIGYLKLNYDLFYRLLNNSVFGALCLMVPPAVASEVLTLYFGWLAFAGSYDFVAKWLTCNPYVPYSFKLKPILSIFPLTITWFLTCCGYGTAVQLVRDSFDPDKYGQLTCDILAAMTKYGLIVYGLINGVQLVEKIAVPAAGRFGSADQKQLVKMLDILQRLAALVAQLEPRLLQKVLVTLNEGQLALFGLTKAGDEIQIKPQETLPSPTVVVRPTNSFWSNCCSFFWSKSEPSHEETGPLLGFGKM